MGLAAVFVAIGMALIFCAFAIEIFLPLLGMTMDEITPKGNSNVSTDIQSNNKRLITTFGWTLCVTQMFCIGFAIIVCLADKKLSDNNPHITAQYNKHANDSSESSSHFIVRILKQAYIAMKEAKSLYWIMLVTLIVNNISLKPFLNFGKIFCFCFCFVVWNIAKMTYDCVCVCLFTLQYQWTIYLNHMVDIPSLLMVV